MRFSPPLDPSVYAGFIFDCDGTLVDTMGLHFSAWRNALAEGGASFDFTWELFLSRAGMSMEQTVQELSEEFGQALDPITISARQRQYFSSLEGEIAAIDEVLEFAKKVGQHAPLAVASGSSRASVERSLARIGASQLFATIVTPEDVKRGKPDPEMFLLAADRMGVPAHSCLVIEDGVLGIEAARRAGMDCAIVQPGPSPL